MNFVERLNKEKKEIHEMAKEKGWWENPRGLDELYSLFHSEVSEAVEEERKPAFPELKDRAMYHFSSSKKAVPGVQWDKDTNTCITKPEGTAVEIVDMVIRILDYAGYADITFVDRTPEKEVPDLSGLKVFARIHGLLGTIYLSRGVFEDSDLEEESTILSEVMNSVKQYFEENKLEFWKVFEAKKSFNSTRSHRHGGRKY